VKRGDELGPFLAHARRCAVCRAFPRMPCVDGVGLLNKGANALARRIDPRRAKA